MTAQDKIWNACVPDGDLHRHPDTGLLLRNRSDAWLIMTMNQDYGLLRGIEYGVNDVALDLGGSIGTFAWYAINRLGIGRVVSVEPLPDHVAAFRRNWHDDARVTLIPGAIVSGDEDTVDLYPDLHHSHGTSLFSSRRLKDAITVDAVAFRDLLESLRPRLVKCDVEGTEYLLDWTNLPLSVTEVVMELHQRSAHPWVEGIPRIDRALVAQGFRHLKAPRYYVRCYNGIQMGVWSR